MRTWPEIEGGQIQRTGILNQLNRNLAKVGQCRNKENSEEPG